MANTAPTFSTLNGTPTYTENGAAVVLDADVQIVDAELAAVGYYGGAILTLARNGGANVQDVFSNSGTLGTLMQGGNLTVGGVIIGTITTNSGGTLTLTFNGSATQSLVNSAMQQIAYSNNSNAPSASAQIDWTFNDGNIGAQGTGGALAVTGNTTVNITSVNDAPSFVIPDGRLTTDFGGGVDSGSSVILQSDGKILVAGSGNISSNFNYDFALARYNADGSMDTSFDTDGKVITAIGLGTDNGYSATVQSDGKILVAGYSYNGNYSDSDFALVRYNADGSLDTSFDTDGKVTTSFGANNDYGNSVTMQADGKILVAGYSQNGTYADFALARYNIDGSLDTSFDGDGKVTTAISTIDDMGSSVAVQSDGKILVAGERQNSSEYDTSGGIALVRYNIDGSLDTSFSGDGKVTTAVSTYGFRSVPSWSDHGRSIILQADGKILVAGYCLNSSNWTEDFALVRYNVDGSLDTSFDTDGKVTTAIGTSTDRGYSVTLQADGKILVSGESYNGSYWDFAMVRYNANGSLDTSFDGDGKVITNFGAQSAGVSVTVQSDDKILVAGSSNNGGSNFALARYNTDGSLDTSFGGTNSLNGTPTYTENGAAVVLDSNAQIVDTELVASGNYAGASLTLARNGGANAQDVFSNSGTLGALAQGGNITVGGVIIGTVTANSGGTLTLTFNSSATQTLANSAMQQIAYSNSSDAPPASVQIDGTFNDGNVGAQGTGGALAATGSMTVSITAVNDAPTGAVTISGIATQGQTLTATNTLADADGLGTISYQWKANGANISGATNSTYVLVDAQVFKTITVVANYTDLYGTAESVISSATSSVMNVNDAPTGGVTISGTEIQGQTLTAANTLADIDGLGIISYQWKGDGTNISGATGGTYTLTQAEVGKAISVVASYTDVHGTAEAVTSSATSVVANVNDAPTGSVTISGTATQNKNLLVSNTLADADGLGSISYQWQADGIAITGATNNTYALTQAEVGKAITVVASYVDGYGTAELVVSSATNAIAPNAAPTGTVTISGTVMQGQTLTATNNLADADGMGAVGYQWQADGIAISGAANSTYTLAEAQVGVTITVTASYIDGYGTAEAVTSSATTAVVNINDAPTGAVTISGTATQNQTLTASNTLADVDGLGTISYQWQANDANISGATNSTYTLTEAEVGKTITVTANYTDGHNTAESMTSSATEAIANVNDAPTGSVTISGTATQGQILTAANTLAEADGLGTIGYQWQADGSNISGATSSTYTLTEAEVGKTITVIASYTDGHSTAESVVSSATTAVANVNDAPTGSVTISGTATQNQTLTATNTLADIDGMGTISYQWQADGANISGATNSTFVLAEAQVGKTITVTTSYTDSHGTTEAVTSSATGAVANVNDAPTGSVTISGTATQGQTLTASNTLADLDGLGTISYQWQSDGANITGATGSTFVLAEAQVGKTITVAASYTDGHGTAELVASNSSANVSAVLATSSTTTSRYTLLGTGTNLMDFYLPYGNLTLDGQNIVFKGNSGIDAVYLGSANGLTFDFTQAGLNVDQIYLSGNWADYSSSYSGSVVTLTRFNGGSETIKTISGDNLIFADGTVSVSSALNYLKGTAAAPVPDSGATSTTFPMTAATLLNNTVRAIVQDASGETIALARPGVAMIAKGGSGIDMVYVTSGANLDGTQLGLGQDKLYLTGNWADYSGTYAGSVVTLTRAVGTDTETVKFLGGSASAYDSIVFADGTANSIDILNYLKGTASAPTLNTTEVTPLGTGDILAGTTGADTLNGTIAGDTLYGNGGADTLNGGAGNDTIVISDAGTTAINSATIVFTSTANGTDTVIDFSAAAVANGGDVLDFFAIANLTDAVATGQTLASDFTASNVFIFDGTPITIVDAANAIATNVSALATAGYIVIADSANGNAVTVYHSTDLAANGVETALAILSGVNITSLTAANFVI